MCEQRARYENLMQQQPNIKRKQIKIIENLN